MKTLDDRIIGPPGSNISAGCSVCGITSETAPYLVFWRGMTGVIRCANCHCESLSGELKGVMTENQTIKDTYSAQLEKVLTNAMKTQQVMEKKIKELESRL